MRFFLTAMATAALLLMLAAPASTQDAQQPLTVTPGSGTTETMFVISGEGCTDATVNWQVHPRHPTESGQVLLFGTAEPAEDGTWSSIPFLGDLGGAGAGEYRADAVCGFAEADSQDYLSATFTVTESPTSQTTPTTTAPPPRMTG